MRKFKKGDKVRCTGPNIFGDESCIEYEGIITRDENQYSLGVDKKWTMDRYNLELIKAVKPTMRKFKKGDKVRCIGKSAYGDSEAIGFEGHITTIWADGTFSIDKNWVLAPEELELIKAAKPARKELKKEIKKLKDKVEDLCYQATAIQQESESMKSDYEILVKEANANASYWMDKYYTEKAAREDAEQETPQLQRGDSVRLIDDGVHLKKGTISTVKKVIHNGAVQLETSCCEPSSKLERQ